jgi:hypothetical protein
MISVVSEVLYFRLSDEELVLEFDLSSPCVDPRLWREIERRGLIGRVNRLARIAPVR